MHAFAYAYAYPSKLNGLHFTFVACPSALIIHDPISSDTLSHSHPAASALRLLTPRPSRARAAINPIPIRVGLGCFPIHQRE